MINPKGELTIYDMINEISKKMNTDGNKTVLEIEKTDNPDVKKLNLKSGSWEDDEPWFIVDENKKLHTMMTVKSVNKIIEKFKAAQEESFNLKLEKTIWQNIPIDFNDVWVVAMDEIKKRANGEPKNLKVINIDLEKLITKIKKEHPNLFLNISNMILD
jgi:hypothetical protein